MGLEGYGWPGLTVRDGDIDGFFISGQFDFWEGGGGGYGLFGLCIKNFFPQTPGDRIETHTKNKVKNVFSLKILSSEMQKSDCHVKNRY